MRRFKLKNLKPNEAILEIRGCNHVKVWEYRQAMRAGVEFSPIVYDTVHKVVVDGIRRLEALRLEYGPDHYVNVEDIECPDQCAIYQEFCVRNKHHYDPLTTFQKKLLTEALQEYNVPLSKIAQLLDLPEKELKRVYYGGGISVVQRVSGQNTEPVLVNRPVKACVTPSAVGTAVTEEQYEEHKRKDIGVSDVAMARQLTRHLRNGWVDLGDEKVFKALEALYEELEDLI